MNRVWGWITGFGRFWYSFIIGDDWASAAGVLIMLGAAYGLIQAHVPAWWAGPVVITITLLITLRRAGQRQTAAQPAGAGAESAAPSPDKAAPDGAAPGGAAHDGAAQHGRDRDAGVRSGQGARDY